LCDSLKYMLTCRYLVERNPSHLAYWKNGSGARTLPEGKLNMFSPYEEVADQCSVNLGGWLVTERKLRPSDSLCKADDIAFIVPALYERYQNSTPKAIDEYTLSQA
jgi:hypothetical protein